MIFDDLERDSFLRELKAGAEAAGVPADEDWDRQVSVRADSAGHEYTWSYAERAHIRMRDRDDLLQKILLVPIAKAAEGWVAATPAPGESPSERAFARQVELMARVRADWAERLRRRGDEILRRPGWRKL